MGLMMLMREAMEAYTGLSPTAFFTILALMLGVYQLVSSMFVFDDASQQNLNNKKKSPPTPTPTSTLTESEESTATASAAASANSVLFQNNSAVAENIGEVTEEELRAYDGSDPTKPLLMAIKGQIYDVSPSRLFYGPGGPYALFAGRDASRALALMSFDPSDLTGNIEGLDASELEVLQDWEYKFQEKYAKVGNIVAQGTRNNGTGSSDRSHGNQETAGDAPI